MLVRVTPVCLVLPCLLTHPLQPASAGAGWIHENLFVISESPDLSGLSPSLSPCLASSSVFSQLFAPVLMAPPLTSQALFSAFTSWFALITHRPFFQARQIRRLFVCHTHLSLSQRSRSVKAWSQSCSQEHLGLSFVEGPQHPTVPGCSSSDLPCQYCHLFPSTRQYSCSKQNLPQGLCTCYIVVRIPYISLHIIDQQLLLLCRLTQFTIFACMGHDFVFHAFCQDL